MLLAFPHWEAAPQRKLRLLLVPFTASCSLNAFALSYLHLPSSPFTFNIVDIFFIFPTPIPFDDDGIHDDDCDCDCRGCVPYQCLVDALLHFLGYAQYSLCSTCNMVSNKCYLFLQSVSLDDRMTVEGARLLICDGLPTFFFTRLLSSVRPLGIRLPSGPMSSEWVVTTLHLSIPPAPIFNILSAYPPCASCSTNLQNDDDSEIFSYDCPSDMAKDTDLYTSYSRLRICSMHMVPRYLTHPELPVPFSTHFDQEEMPRTQFTSNPSGRSSLDQIPFHLSTGLAIWLFPSPSFTIMLLNNPRPPRLLHYQKPRESSILPVFAYLAKYISWLIITQDSTLPSCLPKCQK